MKSKSSAQTVRLCLSSAIIGHDPVLPDESTNGEEDSTTAEASNQESSGNDASSESGDGKRQDSSADANSSPNEGETSAGEPSSTTTNEKTSPSLRDGAKQCLKRNQCLKTLSSETEAESSTDAEKFSDVSTDRRGKQQKCKGKGSVASSETQSEGASESNQSSEPRDTTSHGADDSSAPDDSGWSMSEDIMLRGMKESPDNLSWADIGKGLNRNKNDVKARWKVIKDRAPANADTETENHETASRTGDDEDKGTSATQTTDGSKGTTAKHKGQRNYKVAQETREAKKRAEKASQSQMEVLSGEEASSEESAATDDEGQDESGSQAEHRRQLRYHHKHIYDTLYPAEIEIEPDEYLSAQDAAILAAVDGRYKRARWLEMQANFFNVTGLMIPLHVLRDKCEVAETRARSNSASTRDVPREVKSRGDAERRINRAGGRNSDSEA